MSLLSRRAASVFLGVSGLFALETCSQHVAQQPTPQLTYYKDVKTIVDVACTNCHTQGGIAPFPLTTADEVVQNASLMQEEVSAGLMPPWPPDDSCNDYLRDRSLSAADKTTLLSWLGSERAVGDPSDAPVEPPHGPPGLSRVDFSLTMPTAYTPRTSPDEYRCFLLDWPETTTKYVTGFGVEPGDPKIVHHVIAYLAPPSDVPDFQALDGQDGFPGWECFGGPGGPNTDFGWLGAWAPGTIGSDAPAGSGIEVVAGTKVILQVHYNTLVNKPAPDQTSVEVEVADSVQKQAFVLPYTNPDWLNPDMNIPANDPDASYAFSVDVTPYLSLITNGVYQNNTPFTIWGSALHMHTRGTHATLSVQHADGSNSCMLNIPAWNFNWQGMYSLQQPMTVNPGDQLVLECHWNNTASNQPVVDGVQEPSHDLNWGETTEDEMCLGIFYVTQ